MKILFITSTIASIIVIALLVVINVIYNKDLSKATQNNEEFEPTITTDKSTKEIQPTNTITNTITNTNKKPHPENTLEIPRIQKIKCDRP